MVEAAPLIPEHGGCRTLKSAQIAPLICDVTVRFCELYVDRVIRNRSGVQNSAECGRARPLPRQPDYSSPMSPGTA